MCHRSPDRASAVSPCPRVEEEKRPDACSPLSLMCPPSSLILTRLCLSSLSPLSCLSELQRHAITAAPLVSSLVAATALLFD